MTETMDRVTEWFKVLGDKTRLRILALLRARELCVCDLTEALMMSQPGISQHLRRLRLAEFVNERRGGQWVYYSLNMNHPLIQTLLDTLPSVPEDEERLAQSKGCPT